MRILELDKETKNNILENLLKRSPNSYGAFEERVANIIGAVREKKDVALFGYTKQFDGADIDALSVLVTKEEIEEAYANVDPALLEVIRKALVNIKSYHEKQRQCS